jgi:hypothetical protein
MEPIVVGTASPGNIGRDFVAINEGVASRILSIVREGFPRAQRVDSGSPARLPLPAEYRRATGESVVTTEEMNAASQALAHGATHLLVPMITEWKEMRTDDPIGALILPHNSIIVRLRLMQLQIPALAGSVTFRNRARLTLNQKALALLDGRFRQAVLDLVSGAQ